MISQSVLPRLAQHLGESFTWLRCCWGIVLLQLVYHMIATPQPQNMLLPLSPWHNNLTMTSWFWRHFWPTHANCHTSVDRAQPALLANAWQLARVGQNGHQKTFVQAAMQGLWALPLSLVQNIKIIALIIFVILESGSIYL
jgi:hypothetical protein